MSLSHASETAAAHATAEFGWPGGDTPGNVGFPVAVNAEVREALLEVLAQSFPDLADAEVRALTPPRGVIGRFAVIGPKARWFVRVSTRPGEAALEQAMTAYLQVHGVA